jgi:transcriptional regulator with PAS, ATPase and Fis domain
MDFSFAEQMTTIVDNFARNFGTGTVSAPAVTKARKVTKVVAPVIVEPRKAASSREFMVRQPKGQGYQVHFSNAECHMALRKSKGNMNQAAKILGVTCGSVKYRVDNFKGVWPKGMKRLQRGAQQKFTDSDLTAALKLHKGNMSKAAIELKVSAVAVLYRLNKNPALMPKGCKRAGRGRPAKV